MTIGRAIDCDVVLDDPHVAAHHARLERPIAAEPPQLLVGDSRNGARLRGARLGAGTSAALPAGSEWQLGRTRLRLRLAGETLPAEQPLHLPAAEGGRRTGLGLLALVVWQAGEHWLRSDPGDPLASYLPVLLALPVGLAMWSFLWAVGSKLFARHFDFAPHLRLALGVLLTALLADALLPLAARQASLDSLAALQPGDCPAELAAAAQRGGSSHLLEWRAPRLAELQEAAALARPLPAASAQA